MTKKPHELLKDWSKAVTMIDPEKFDFLKEEIPRIIRVRTRLGNGVQNEQIGKLAPLSKAYIAFRKGEMTFRTNKTTGNVFPVFNKMISTKVKSKSGKMINKRISAGDAFDPPELSQFTKPEKSNLTLTGKMLDSIIGIRVGLRFIFTFKDKQSNDKARWNSDKRPFFELSKSEINGVYRQARKVLLEELRSIFKS